MSKPKVNGDISTFFKPKSKQPVPTTSTLSGTNTSNSNKILANSTPTANTKICTTNSDTSSLPSSSLSPPPASKNSSPFDASRTEVPGSDDDDDGNSSDDSLPPLDNIFGSSTGPRTTAQSTTISTSSTIKTPSTPRASRSRKIPTSTFKLSPLAVRTQPQFKFDLKSLVDSAASDAALEESRKRVKFMMEVPDDTDMTEEGGDSIGLSDVHGEILQKIKTDKDDGNGGGAKDAQKVINALRRTEATNVDQQWYFFETEGRSIPGKRKPFPKAAISKEWKDDLADPQFRHQTFVSGFAENMITCGKKLPDEIILWILEESCVEELGDLRHAYNYILKVSSAQVQRLVSPNVVRDMFKSLGATPTALDITEKIRLQNEIPDPYARHHWSRIRSFIGLISQMSKYLQEDTRVQIISLLLRMSIDHVLLERTDLLSLVQIALQSLCKYINRDAWEICCRKICTPLFNSVTKASLRLQIVHSIPSTSSRTHELRRRLALSFYFNTLPPALQDPFTNPSLSIPHYTQRINTPTFDITPHTNYQELSSLILLLSIALDNGRTSHIDLSNRAIETQFNTDVDDLAAAVKGIKISFAGAAYISRTEAKEVIEMVGSRIAISVRSRPKPKHNIYDPKLHGRDRDKGRGEDLGKEQKGMLNFLNLKKKSAVEVVA